MGWGGELRPETREPQAQSHTEAASAHLGPARAAWIAWTRAPRGAPRAGVPA